MNKNILLFCILSIIILNFSCTSLLTGLTDSLYQQKDIELVKDGAPSYLLLVEGLIKSNPKNKDFLKLGIQLFSAYSAAFVKDQERNRIFSEKSKEWAISLLNTYPNFKKSKNTDFEIFEKQINKFSKKDIDYVFWAANAWIMWIISNTENLEALLDLPKARALIDRIYVLDSSYYYGAPHLFYGIFYSFLPEVYGGDLKKSQKEFEEALKYSDDKLLLTKVSYAQYYLKAINDKNKFKQVLEEIINTDTDKYPEQRLMNILAQKQAKELLDNIDNYFYE